MGAVRNSEVCPLSLSFLLSVSLSLSLLYYLMLCLWKYISFQSRMSMEIVFGKASQVFLWDFQRWKVEAEHKPSIMFTLFFSLSHLCGNHFQFVSLLSVPGLSQEDPFMIGCGCHGDPALWREGRTAPQSFAVFKTNDCHFQNCCYGYKIVLAFADCVCLFLWGDERVKDSKKPTDLSQVLFLFTWVLACVHAQICCLCVWFHQRVLLCGVQMLLVHDHSEYSLSQLPNMSTEPCWHDASQCQ